jgi:hypothetical protein
MSKGQTLAECEGFPDLWALVEEVHMDSTVPGICMNHGCEYTTWYEPDQQHGWCEECQESTVCSALILGGVM